MRMMKNHPMNNNRVMSYIIICLSPNKGGYHLKSTWLAGTAVLRPQRPRVAFEYLGPS